MGREKLVTPSAVAQALDNVDKPFISTSEIAEEIGVTAQAVRQNRALLESNSSICVTKVGQNSIYWVGEDRADIDFAEKGQRMWSEKEIRELIQDETNSGE